MLIMLYFLVFPGFLFTAAAGLLASWVDRKVSARVQWRVGPPWYQPFVDIVKLFGKETILPSTANRTLFLAAPLLGVSSVTLISMLVMMAGTDSATGFIGDIIVALYLLSIPSISLILGGFASGNPLASLGASREMKLLLSYEIPFIMACLVPVIKSGGAVSLGGLLSYQAVHGPFVLSISGAPAFIVAVLSMQAKLALAPFDIPEAETELIGGPIIEYSGMPLGMFRLTKAMMLFVVPMFIVAVFMGGIGRGVLGVISGILKYVLLLVIIILIKNTNPRVRSDQALRFFWGIVSVIAVAALVLSSVGL